jgi:hypothetical protein
LPDGFKIGKTYIKLHWWAILLGMLHGLV